MVMNPLCCDIAGPLLVGLSGAEMLKESTADLYYILGFRNITIDSDCMFDPAVIAGATPAANMSDTYSSFEPFLLNTALRAHHVQILAVACAVLAVVGIVFTFAFQARRNPSESPSAIRSFGMFFYASFLKPHTGDSNGTGQQAALESFYRAQVTYACSLYSF